MTGPEIEVRGANQLAEVGLRLKAAGANDLRKELLKGLRTAAKPLVTAVKADVEEYLPRRGGAAAAVRASSIGARTRLSGKNAGLEIKATGRRVRNLAAINAGDLRHPVFGNRNVYVTQRIRPGFFTEPIEKRKGSVQAELLKVLGEVSSRIERPV